VSPSPVSSPASSPASPSGRRPAAEQFSLGRLGLPLNIIAVLFGMFFLIDIGWPRAIVYGAAGYLHYFSLLFVGGCAVLGVISYLRVKQRDKIVVLDNAETVVDNATTADLGLDSA
jgi:hypothetical protein